MQRILLLLALLIVFSSCAEKSKVVTIHPEGYYKEVYHVKDDSVKHGPYIKYFSEAVMADSCNYFEGKIHGTRKIFTNEGLLEIEESYENGVFQGPYKTFYPNGQVKKVMEYVQDKIQGDVKQYYPDGTLKATVQFVDNLENGPFSEFFPNGKLHWKGYYLGGDFEQDTLYEYNDEGSLIRKLYCEKGICQTVWSPKKGYLEREKVFENK